MDWDIELNDLTTKLGAAVRRDVESSFASSRDRAPWKMRNPTVGIRPSGILGAEPSLQEYCRGYVPSLRDTDVDDVQADLLAAGEQALILSSREIQWPVARLGGNNLPIALFDKSALGASYIEFGELRSQIDDYVGKLREGGVEIVMADPGSALLMFTDAMIPFLGTRLLAARLYPAAALSNNTEVSNTQNGWNIVFRPSFVPNTERGLGGPGSPVKGYIRPGTYLFGVKKSGSPTQWDTTIWSVPQRNTIHVPLP